MKGSFVGEKLSTFMPPFTMLDMQITHFNRACFSEYAEDYYKFSETAYKIGSECRYYWRAVL